MDKVEELAGKYVYYCTDCHGFVEERHRCQQWQTVHRIPVEAFKSRDEEIKKLRGVIAGNKTLIISHLKINEENNEKIKELEGLHDDKVRYIEVNLKKYIKARDYFKEENKKLNDLIIALKESE